MNDLELNRTEKKKVLEDLLDDEYLLVHINPRVDGVAIPEHLCRDDTVTLRLSWHFVGPMALEEDKVIAELVFQGERIICEIPYDAVWGCTNASGKNKIWPGFVPKSVLGEMLKESEDDAETPAIPLKKIDHKSRSRDKSKSLSDHKKRVQLKRIK